jgi:hypothetical protein
MAIHPACAERSLHRQGRRSTADSHRILILQLDWWNNLRLSPAVVAASSLHWLPPQPPAFTGCCLLLPNRRRTSDSHRLFHLRLHRFRFTRLAPGVSTSGWAFDAPLTSTEPCIGSKLPMSIQYPPVRASSGSASFDNFRLASVFVISGAASDPSRAFAPGFTL